MEVAPTLQSIASFVMWYLHLAMKWFLHLATRLTELQRICYGEDPGGPRTLGVGRSLALTRSLVIQDACHQLDLVIENGSDAKTEGEAVDRLVEKVCDVKNIKKQLHGQFVHSLRACICQIWGYKRLKKSVEALRSTPFDDQNVQHEEMLMELWDALQPDKPLPSRRTKSWQLIGFQGEDPKTDFRGMGILGLQNLVHFVRDYKKAARHVLSHSHHPQHGYSFAIVGINLSHMAHKLLMDGSVRSHMYNVTENGKPCNINNFHHLYSYLFVEFDKLWMQEKPENVMEFNRIRDLFESLIRSLLSDSKMCLRISLVVDEI